MTLSIPSVIISCTFHFFPAFCFLLGDSSVIIKSILYDSVSKNSLRNRQTVKPSLLIRMPKWRGTVSVLSAEWKTWLYCKIVCKFAFFSLLLFITNLVRQLVHHTLWKMSWEDSTPAIEKIVPCSSSDYICKLLRTDQSTDWRVTKLYDLKVVI